MADQRETPFDSIEGAHEYIEMLLEMIEEVRSDVASDMEAKENVRSPRRMEALKLVSHKLERLEFHTARSRRLLNDLRMLRRLLLDERGIEEQVEEAASAAGAD